MGGGKQAVLNFLNTRKACSDSLMKHAHVILMLNVNKDTLSETVNFPEFFLLLNFIHWPPETGLSAIIGKSAWLIDLQ